MAEKNKAIGDLAQNWSGSIALKLTAVSLWIILVLSFVMTMPFVSSFEENRLKKYAWQNAQIRQQAIKLLQQSPNVLVLENALKSALKKTDIKYLSVKLNDEKFDLGVSDARNYSNNELVQVPGSNNIVDMHLEFAPIKWSVDMDRTKIGSAIVSFAVLFGLILFYINRKIIHAPFRQYIELTQKITQGETSLRLDTIRQDEFGVLSKFLNQMLDTLESNQLALKKANQELVYEIQHREEALAASQQKSTFLANMSHEIRTPLSSIIGYTERIRFDKAKDKQDEKEMLDIVLQNGNHLLHLINDILDLSKVEANKLEIEDGSYSVFNIVDHTKNLLSDKALNQSTRLIIDYQFPIPKVIHNDPVRTKQVVLNLASNAIRFTENGTVTVQVAFDEQQDSLIIEVKDTGRGMTTDELSRLFKPFSQADASITRNYGGTGLGLTISKRLAQLMGGDITVESIKGLGSRFVCKIKAGFQQGDERVHVSSDITNVLSVYECPVDIMVLSGRVLLVEDTPEIQKLVKAYLEDYGIDIDTADNGRQGVARAMENDYDLVLMDVQMPELNGKDATRELRDTGYEKPIVALTADVMSQRAEEYKAMGFNEILTKPIVIKEMLEVLRYYLCGEPECDKFIAANQPRLVGTIEQLKDKFLDQLPGQVEEIISAIEDETIDVAQGVLHKIKGVGGSLGLPQISQRAEDISNLLKSMDIERAREEILGLEIYYTTSSDGLKFK